MKFFCGIIPEMYMLNEKFIGIASWRNAKQHWVGIGFV